MTNPAVTPEQLLLDLAQEITALKAQIALSTQAPAVSQLANKWRHCFLSSVFP